MAGEVKSFFGGHEVYSWWRNEVLLDPAGLAFDRYGDRTYQFPTWSVQGYIEDIISNVQAYSADIAALVAAMTPRGAQTQMGKFLHYVVRGVPNGVVFGTVNKYRFVDINGDRRVFFYISHRERAIERWNSLWKSVAGGSHHHMQIEAADLIA